MKLLDWNRVKLLVRLRQTLKRNAAQRVTGVSHTVELALTGLMSAAAGIGLFLFGALGSPSNLGMLTWDMWALAVAYFWLASLSAEAQRGDAIDLTRLMHLPVSLREAVAVNFTASLWSPPNVIGSAGALGFCLGMGLRQPAALLLLPFALLWLLAVSVWVYVLRSWFLKVFTDPRRRRLLTVIASLILVFAGQAPNLINLLANSGRSAGSELREYMEKREFTRKAWESESTPWEPIFATPPPPGTICKGQTVRHGYAKSEARAYWSPDGLEIYRLSWKRLKNRSSTGPWWEYCYWKVEDGRWRKTEVPSEVIQASGGSAAIFANSQSPVEDKIQANLEGTPVDFRRLWPSAFMDQMLEQKLGKQPEIRYSSMFNGLKSPVVHQTVPLLWQGWVASSVSSGTVWPLLVVCAGLTTFFWLGLRRSWRIQQGAFLQQDSGKAAQSAAAKPGKVSVPWSPASDDAARMTRRLPLLPRAASCLSRAYMRQWLRSVEGRFSMIMATAMGAGALGAGFLLWWKSRDARSAFHVISSMSAFVCLGMLSLAANLFGTDRGAGRALVLAPVSARTVLLAKNAALIRLYLCITFLLAAGAACITRAWLPCAALWLLLSPAAILMSLAVGNASSVANPWPYRVGYRNASQASAGAAGKGCLYLIAFMALLLVLQIPQAVAALSIGWGMATAALILAGSIWAWLASLSMNSAALGRSLPQIAETVGRSSDM